MLTRPLLNECSQRKALRDALLREGCTGIFWKVAFGIQPCVWYLNFLVALGCIVVAICVHLETMPGWEKLGNLGLPDEVKLAGSLDVSAPELFGIAIPVVTTLTLVCYDQALRWREVNDDCLAFARPEYDESLVLKRLQENTIRTLSVEAFLVLLPLFTFGYWGVLFAFALHLCVANKMMLEITIKVTTQVSHSIVKGVLEDFDLKTPPKFKPLKVKLVTAKEWDAMIKEHRAMLDEINQLWKQVGKVVALGELPLLVWAVLFCLPAYYGLMASRHWHTAAISWLCVVGFVGLAGLDVYPLGEVTDMCKNFKKKAGEYYYRDDLAHDKHLEKSWEETSKVYPTRFINYLDTCGTGGINIWILGRFSRASIKKYAGVVATSLPAIASCFKFLKVLNVFKGLVK